VAIIPGTSLQPVLVFIGTSDVLGKRLHFHADSVPVFSLVDESCSFFQMERESAVDSGTVFFSHIFSLLIQAVGIDNFKKDRIAVFPKEFPQGRKESLHIRHSCHKDPPGCRWYRWLCRLLSFSPPPEASSGQVDFFHFSLSIKKAPRYEPGADLFLFYLSW